MNGKTLGFLEEVSKQLFEKFNRDSVVFYGADNTVKDSKRIYYGPHTFRSMLYYAANRELGIFLYGFGQNSTNIENIYVRSDWENVQRKKKEDVKYVRIIDIFKPTGPIITAYLEDDEDARYIYEQYWQPPLESLEKDQWIKEGGCPECGEKGKLVNFKPRCSKHGFYEFKNLNGAK